MLASTGCAPYELGLILVQLQTVGIHPVCNDTESHEHTIAKTFVALTHLDMQSYHMKPSDCKRLHCSTNGFRNVCMDGFEEPNHKQNRQPSDVKQQLINNTLQWPNAAWWWFKGFNTITVPCQENVAIDKKIELHDIVHVCLFCMSWRF